MPLIGFILLNNDDLSGLFPRIKCFWWNKNIIHFISEWFQAVTSKSIQINPCTNQPPSVEFGHRERLKMILRPNKKFWQLRMYQSPSLFNRTTQNPPDFSGGVAHCVTHFRLILDHCHQKSAQKRYQKWVFSQKKIFGNYDCCDKKACQTEKSNSFYFFLAAWHIALHFSGQVRADYTSELAYGLTCILHLPGVYYLSSFLGFQARKI